MVPLMIGCCIHILLTGLIFSMMARFIMTGRFSREPPWMRLIITSTFILNIFQLLVSVGDVIFWAANQNRTYDRFFEGTYMDSLTPLLVGLIAFQVQGVYGWRAWCVFKTPWRKWVFVAVLVPTMIAAFLGGLVTTIINFGYVTQRFDSAGLLDFDTMTSMWLWGSFCVDTGISATLWFLFRSNVAGFNQRMDSVLLKLARLAIQSGSYTALTALLGALTAEVFTSDYTIAISYLFLPLYTISLFVTLNAKQGLNDSLQHPSSLPTGVTGSRGSAVPMSKVSIPASQNNLDPNTFRVSMPGTERSVSQISLT
ncbi:hypothetical protein MNV49_002717 [Pseudohyphozyma bogoriensis]|nr:hypothetical protein MNV49_002717 [Pseudohyphozyma bogoriensis]